MGMNVLGQYGIVQKCARSVYITLLVQHTALVFPPISLTLLTLVCHPSQLRQHTTCLTDSGTSSMPSTLSAKLRTPPTQQMLASHPHQHSTLTTNSSMPTKPLTQARYPRNSFQHATHAITPHMPLTLAQIAKHLSNSEMNHAKSFFVRMILSNARARNICSIAK